MYAVVRRIIIVFHNTRYPIWHENFGKREMPDSNPDQRMLLCFAVKAFILSAETCSKMPISISDIEELQIPKRDCITDNSFFLSHLIASINLAFVVSI